MVSRRFLLTIPLLSGLLPAAGCADSEAPSPAPHPAAPPDYSYLNRLSLNVADLEFDDQAPTAGIAPSGGSAAEALATMGRQRLAAVGGTGRAVFTIRQAGIEQTPSGLEGRLQVRLDIMLSDGNPAAYAEASAARTLAGPAPDPQAAAAELLRQMMADMNVEFEYQVRHALAAWLVTDRTKLNPVQASDLPGL